MTESKDIEEILYMGVGRSGLENEPSKIAKALNELLAYRAIGTVEELKAIRSASELWEYNNNLAYVQGRHDAIDEFAERLKAKIEEVHSAPEQETAYNNGWKTVCRIIQSNLETIAEQMRKGEKE